MKGTFLFLISLIVCSTTYGQVVINFPVNKAVFQRDNNNRCLLPISGNYIGDVDKVEARLVPVRIGQGTLSDWQVVQQNPEAGYFYGKISGLGGWYVLEVRTSFKGQEKSVTVLDRVGIGEVILISGQSNAQGRRLFGAKSSTDERVNKVDLFNEHDNFDNFDIKPFTSITGEGNIAPGGESGWCWGELGDHLAKKLNVPIAFFNAGWGGIVYFGWTASLKGETVTNFYGELPANQPYANLKYMGQFYASLYGARAMLWTQGEGQEENFPPDYSATVYANSIQAVFNRFRADIGKNIAIVVSRTSLSERPGSTQKTIDGQNMLIDKVGNNVFKGPFTDTIQVNRPDGSHFQNVPGDAGISKLAVAWNQALTEDFFKISTPILPAQIVPIAQAICKNGANPVLKISDDYSYQRWSNGVKTKELEAPVGFYSAILRDRTGNAFLTPRINTQNIRPTSIPTVSVNGQMAFCAGESVELKAAGDFKSFRWNTDDTTKAITIKRGGEYSVQGVNQYGCFSLESRAIGITVYSLPAKPVLEVNTPLSFCQGGQVVINGPANMTKYTWTPTGLNLKSIVVQQSGFFALKVTDINGCESPQSDALAVSVKANPPSPTLRSVGSYTLEAVVPAAAQATDVFLWQKDGQSLSQNGSILKAINDGKYTAQLSRVYTINNAQKITCKSPFSQELNYQLTNAFENGFSIYPNPAPSGLIFVETKEDLQDAQVFVYNLKGQLAFSGNIPLLVTRQQIDLSSLPRGLYIIKIKTSNYEAQRRLLIQ